ncbi:TPA: alpha-amylase, partial [bacterium]|nr:alpha-amylase [bacterium]
MPSAYLSFEFHISKEARDRYQFKEDLDTIGSVRLLAQKMNEQRNLVLNPEAIARAGELNAMSLIHLVLHCVSAKYREVKNPSALKNAFIWLCDRFRKDIYYSTVIMFTDEFPPLAVYKNMLPSQIYLRGKTDKIPNLEIAIEELISLYLANVNPAFAPYLELFTDLSLERRTPYSRMVDSLIDYFKTQPTFGPDDEPLIELLMAPAKASPYSLTGQLMYIIARWRDLIPKELLHRLSVGLDLIREEEKFRAMGKGPILLPDFRIIDTGLGPEYERFSPDLDWMPRVVLIAKNIYVWLYQLSKRYDRKISRLNEIPDEELDILASWGFTALWLIGLWERSPASQKIKQWTGNPEAISSAYSLYDYTIAEDLGGEEALRNLRDRAAQRGIRLASDMVPNHTGIYSRWIIEHPDWFLQLDHSPFPSYRFTGGNLSSDDRVGIYLEDGYWDRRDAAVVFKRVDHWTGHERYIYHGNDGTHMPWNDTAQLNFCLPEVREAVIQTIIHVARLFPIIRFDAAMTLTKRHYQRLWFPQPGEGGDIPSRAGHGLTREEFNRLFPNEFWREVVDRVAEEAPGTLLLAEAFWLMEGYFVRTLGMHRVYNSAFMNMLKMEENAKYRRLLKDVLAFNPQILKRFVNFMSNPDEETSIAQFGKDDKYFGVCLMMVTLPGLPMFGHGQIEGFTEKYGMEYRRSYWDEEVDWNLVARHKQEIFPLLKKRYLFADAENFVLYDLCHENGSINENVFCYSNMCGEERALILYNNRFKRASGWIKGLGEGLRLKNDPLHYYIFRDHKSNLEYIREGKELVERGLYIELDAFKYHIFLSFREVYDQDGSYRDLCHDLRGRGVTDIVKVGIELRLRPIHTPFREIINPVTLRRLWQKEAIEDFEDRLRAFFNAFREFDERIDPDILTCNTQKKISTILQLERLDLLYPWPESTKYKEAFDYLRSYMPRSSGNLLYWRIPMSWSVVSEL